MKPTNEILKKYAELIARTGVNVQKGQVVTLTASVEEHAFACLVMEECYKAGAKKVNIDWSCDQQTRLNYIYADEDVLGTTLPWEEAKLKQMVEDLPCRIFIESEDPDALAGLDPEKLSSVMQQRGIVRKPYRDAIDGKHQWLIAAIPSPAWAKKCFPDCDEETAVEKLWDAILKTVRVDEAGDPVAQWQAHTDFMIEKAEWLNAQKFTSLHYTSSNGTDFKVELIPDAKWEGAKAVNNLNGAAYIPNMPTEECFCMPDKDNVNGIVYASKPLNYSGKVIENFWFKFENGAVVDYGAEKGLDALTNLIETDEGSKHLGEVALISYDSPISNLNILFFNTLFDENASCHLALGRCYPENIQGGVDMSEEELLAAGGNQSMNHVDFMFGTSDMEVTGIQEDGTEVTVFHNGNFVF